MLNNGKIGEYVLQDFVRMCEAPFLAGGHAWVREGGVIFLLRGDGYSLTFEGDGIVRVRFGYLESRAYDEHAYYARGFEGRAFPRRCLDIYKYEISVGHVKREDEK